MKTWTPPKKIDSEVVALCRAVNAISPRIRTTSSCSGHGAEPLVVEFETRSPDALRVILWALDRKSLYRPRRQPEFELALYTTEVLDVPVGYVLRSVGVGKKAYGAADVLAEKILESKRFLAGWKADERR